MATMLDPLVQSDLELSSSTPPGEKLAQALELMHTGLRLKRAALQQRAPHASEAEIEAQLERWLLSGD